MISCLQVVVTISFTCESSPCSISSIIFNKIRLALLVAVQSFRLNFRVHVVAIIPIGFHKEHRIGDLGLCVFATVSQCQSHCSCSRWDLWNVPCRQRNSTWNVLQVTVCGVAEAVVFVLYGGMLQWRTAHKHPPPPAAPPTLALAEEFIF